MEVERRYGEVVALAPTSLTIPAGEFFVIIGSSGSGKSTLLGAVAGFVEPSAGSVRLGGSDLVSLPPHRRNIGMVFQNYALFPHMTVAQNIAFPLKMRGVARSEVDARVEDMLKVVRLQGFDGRRPAELSGGQQQRVALARAAIAQPSLLLMDEPLGALDRNLRSEMQDEIRQFHKRLGCTVLYVTHDQEEAASLADRVAVMRGGRIVQLGSPRDLYDTPVDLFVARFVGDANVFEVTWFERDVDGVARLRTIDGVEMRALDKVTERREQAPSVVIRPQQIRFGAAGPQENEAEGLITAALFVSGSMHYRILLPGGRDLAMHLDGRSDSAHGIGERVKVAWPVNRTLLL